MQVHFPAKQLGKLPNDRKSQTGAFVFAQVQTIENRIGKALCPMRLLRRLIAWFR